MHSISMYIAGMTRRICRHKPRSPSMAPNTQPMTCLGRRRHLRPQVRSGSRRLPNSMPLGLRIGKRFQETRCDRLRHTMAHVHFQFQPSRTARPPLSRASRLASGSSSCAFQVTPHQSCCRKLLQRADRHAALSVSPSLSSTHICIRSDIDPSGPTSLGLVLSCLFPTYLLPLA